MKKLAALTALLVLAATPAWPQAYPGLTGTPGQPPITGVGSGFDPSNQAANFNQLIATIDRIFAVSNPYVPNAVNFLQVTAGTTGVGVSVGLAPGGDANAAIKVTPAGNGNIVLFSSLTNQSSRGLVKIGNLASWAPMQGIAACPGVVAGKAAFGMSDHLTGYWLVKDWLDRNHGLPAC